MRKGSIFTLRVSLLKLGEGIELPFLKTRILSKEQKGNSIYCIQCLLKYNLNLKQNPPSFIKESGLSDASGYVDVHKHTLQHNRYQNVWALGDSSNLPTSKTAAAIMSQAPVLTHNLVNYMRSTGEPKPAYEGYTSCPIFTSQSKLLLAEFKYDGVIDETFGGPI